MIEGFRYYLRIYWMIVTQYIKARMQYRMDFFISSIGMFFTSITSIALFGVLLSSIDTLDGWNLNELVFIYAFYLLATAPLQLFFDNIWSLRFKVQDGSFIKYYFRPLDMMFYYMSEVFDIKGIIQVLMGFAAFGYASVELGLDWSIQRFLILVMLLFGSSLVMISVMIIASCSTFWIINSFPVISLTFKMREFAQYPMTIFDGVFRVLFTYILPIGFIAFYPAQLFLRPDEVSATVYISPLVGVVAFVVAYWVWNRGINHYGGTGT
jgi:ABC-2 type transport system permease protein